MKAYKGVKIKKVSTTGRWYARVKVANCKYYDIWAKTQAECYEKLKSFLDNPKLLKGMQREALKPTDKHAKVKYTLDSWYEYWKATFKAPQSRGSSLRRMDYVYSKHVKPILGKIKLSDITTQVIQEFLAGIESNSMRIKVYTHLADMIKKAYQTDVIKKNPCLAVVRPKYKPQERMAMEPEEQQLFLEAAKDSKYYCIYALMLFEGLRTGEAKALRHCDIKKEYIIVRASMNDINEITATKTGNIRRIPIFAAFRPIADALRSDSSELIAGKPNKHTANKEFHKIMTQLGMNYNMYSLRHTFATNCARSGIVSKQVAIWMGHSDVSTTLKYYTNISDSFEAANIKALDTNFATNLSNTTDSE